MTISINSNYAEIDIITKSLTNTRQIIFNSILLKNDYNTKKTNSNKKKTIRTTLATSTLRQKPGLHCQRPKRRIRSHEHTHTHAHATKRRPIRAWPRDDPLNLHHAHAPTGGEGAAPPRRATSRRIQSIRTAHTHTQKGDRDGGCAHEPQTNSSPDTVRSEQLRGEGRSRRPGTEPLEVMAERRCKSNDRAHAHYLSAARALRPSGVLLAGAPVALPVGGGPPGRSLQVPGPGKRKR